MTHPSWGPDTDDFDQALLGQTVQHIGRDRTTTGSSFNRNGALTADPACPFAGVLAFVGMQMPAALDPVMFLNPHQSWTLPDAIEGLRQRSFGGGTDAED